VQTTDAPWHCIENTIRGAAISLHSALLNCAVQAGALYIAIWALFHGTPTFCTTMLPTARHCPAQDAVARCLRGVDVGCYWRVGWRAEAIESAAGREDEGMMG